MFSLNLYLVRIKGVLCRDFEVELCIIVCGVLGTLFRGI